MIQPLAVPYCFWVSCTDVGEIFCMHGLLVISMHACAAAKYLVALFSVIACEGVVHSGKVCAVEKCNFDVNLVCCKPCPTCS
jgi:hypothetical protein